MLDKKDLVLIVPSKRIFTFIKKELIALIPENEVIRLPEVLSPNQLFQKLGDVQALNQFEASVWLYHIQNEIAENPESDFAQFFHTAQTFLSDINEVDQYLVDAKNLFTNIRDVKEIEAWSFNQDEDLSEGQHKFLDQMAEFFEIYSAFQQKQKKEGQFTTGGLNRLLATEGFTVPDKWKNTSFFILGLNAISEAEKGIYKHLQDQIDVSFFWDIDPYLMGDVPWDANLFIKKNQSDLGGEILPKTSAFNNPKQISVSEMANSSAMHTFAGNQLDPLSDLAKSAILMDEGGLPQVLVGIPSESQINISMGLPLIKTNLFSFFQQTIRIVHEFQRKQFLTFTQLTSWTQQSLFSFFWEQPSIQDFEKSFPDGYCRLQGESDIPCIQYLRVEAQKNSARHFLGDWKNRMLEKDFQHQDAIFIESYHRFLSFLSETEQALLENDLEFELPGLSFISKSFIQGEEIDLVGEPLTNHQIMGLLETRGLSFEHVIFCGANEKAIPGNSNRDSFIPMDLRTAYGLPGIKEKEAVFSYYFFMLVFAAKNIHLLYLADSSLNKGDEPSRYLRQLEFITKENPNWNWITKPVISSIGQTPSTPIIYRTEAINKAINAYAHKQFSASSINLFFTSPLNFILEKILKIRDNDAVSEQQSPMEFGEIIHQCLEELFKPFIGKTIGLENIKSFDAQFETILNNITQNKFGKPKDKLLGLKRINIELGIEILSSYLKDEGKDLKKIKDEGNILSIIDLEKHVERDFVGKKMQFSVHGFIDRVDRVGTEIRLLDYKTGKAKISLRNLEENILKSEPTHNLARQLILYAWLMIPYCRENGYTLSTGVYSFKDDKVGKHYMSLDLDEYEEMGNAILQHIEDNLFFGELDFVHPESLPTGYGIIE